MEGIKLYAAMGAIFVAFLCGWFSNGWRLGVKMERQRAAYTQALADTTQEAFDKQKENAKKLSKIDARRTKELSNAQSQINDLRARLANGSIGLRIAAHCTSLPHTATASGLGDGAAAQLTENAEQHYFALREAIVRINAQLIACQDILKER